MAGRGLLVLAFVTVLLGAPSAASAAGNSLVALPPAPMSGTTETMFVFRVAYAGRFEATAVTAQVAGRAIGMVRVSGTALAGTWSVGTVLPAGTWYATITADAARGNSPSVQTAPVSVISASSPQPPPATPVSAPSGPGGPMASPDRGGEEPIGGGVVPTGEAAVASSEPSSDPVAAPATPAGGGTGLPGEDATDRATGEIDRGANDGAAAPTGYAADAPGAPESGGAPGPSATTPAATGLRAPSTRDGRTPATEGRTPFADDEATSSVLPGGLVAVAAVALLGSTMLLLARRRWSGPEPAVPSSAPGLAEPTAEEAVAATLRARTVRRARERLDEDPILAALGIDEAASARRARVRGTQVNRGSGERPASR